MIGGPMGVGKTTVCNVLKKQLPHSVFLDGDWCWNSRPFTVTEETKKMVLENICFLLNSFLGCSVYENVIFCWVLHEQNIIDSILENIKKPADVKIISLICDRKTLTARLAADIEKGLREKDIIAKSLERLGSYETVNSVKIDVSRLTAEETAKIIANL